MNTKKFHLVVCFLVSVLFILYTGTYVLASEKTIKAKMYPFSGMFAENGDISFNFIDENGETFTGVLAYVKLSREGDETAFMDWFYKYYNSSKWVYVTVIYQNPKTPKNSTVSINLMNQEHLSTDLAANLVHDGIVIPDDYCLNPTINRGDKICKKLLEIMTMRDIEQIKTELTGS